MRMDLLFYVNQSERLSEQTDENVRIIGLLECPAESIFMDKSLAEWKIMCTFATKIKE